MPAPRKRAPFIHPVIVAWMEQLTNEDITSLVERDGQIEVRLYANRGKVAKTPVIVLNHGPSVLD